MTAAFPLRWPEGWPRIPANRRKDSGAFSVTYDKALGGLYHALSIMGAKSVVVSSFLQLNKQNQVLSGNARHQLPDPGVAVYFWRAEKEYALAQDAFDTVLGNTRSIGLALDGLRQLERHGGAHLAERAFGGFAALPPPEKPLDWREELGLVGLQNDDKAMLLFIADAAFKRAAKAAHPDSGGSHERMARLNKAIEAARKELQA